MTAARTALVLGALLAATAIPASAQTGTRTTVTVTLTPPVIYAGVPTAVPFVVSAGPGVVPTGSVTIRSADLTAACTAAVSAGQCTLLIWAVGEQSLIATYSGSGALLPAIGSEVVQVLGGVYSSRTAAGAISPWSPMAGEPVQVGFHVSACMPPFAVCVGLDGPVTVTDESDPDTTCTTPAPYDQRRCTLVFRTSGLHTLRAVYAGSGAFAPSAGVHTLTVGPRVLALADGVTGPALDTYLLLANPGPTPEPALVTLFRDDKTTADVSVVVPPHERVTWKAAALPALAGRAFSARVTVPSGRPLFVERATYVAADYRGGHAAMARAPSDRAFFAEGCQNSLFDTYLLIGNQANEPAWVSVRFAIEGGGDVARTYAVPAGVRLTIAAAGIPELVGRSFGIVVESSSSNPERIVPIVVERAIYVGRDAAGGHSDVGVSQPSTTWLFAEGAAGPTFDTFLLLMNPNAASASATVTFHPEGRDTVTTTRVVPAFGRVTIAVERDAPTLADAAFWIDVRSDQPVVAERAMYWSSDGGPLWTEGHVSAGATAAGPRWGFAEGIVGGGLEFKTFLLVANPGTSPAVVDVRYLPTGGGPVTRVHTVPAGGRLAIDVGADVPALRDVPFGATVIARAGAAVVAERSVYWMRQGRLFIGGTNAVGLGF